MAGGGIAEGLDVIAQTIQCADCREIRDAVIALRVPLDAPPYSSAPPLEDVINPLQPNRPGAWRWDHFEPACLMDSSHEVEPWNQPGKCPRCGVFLEATGLPFRQWP
jgi:hypothetical protein